jgi:glutamyl-Q tRNA(Asp) synthetase
MNSPLIGRFAPSPSGPLHFGSLVAALGSYLIARQNQGLWLMRIEDIDPPREMPGAADDILRTLESFGFEWDGQVMYQSRRSEHYLNALQSLRDKGLLYACDCSRKMVLERNQGIYDRYCLTRHIADENHCALRVKFDQNFSAFYDHILGACHFDQQEYLQDFVVRRSDQLFAYQLAVVVDDIAQDVNQIVRGADILDSTPRQNLLYHYFEQSPPAYYHLPLVVDLQGHKLSKSRFSPAISPAHATRWLSKAYQHLGQAIATDAEALSPMDFLHWAVANFDLQKVGSTAIRYRADELDIRT